MAKPYKTKDGRWRVDVELPRKADGSRNRQPVYGDTKQECIKNEFEFKKELEEQNILNSKDITVAQYFERWLEINCDQLSPSSHDSYKRYTKSYILPVIGSVRMCDILQMHIQELVNNFSKTHKSKSSTCLKGILHKAFKDAITNKIINSNPCIDIKIKRSKDYEYYIYDEEEFNNLLNCVKDTKEEIPIVLASLCGMRMGEIMGLMWENVNFDNKSLNINKSAITLTGGVIIKEPKTYSSNRIIEMPDYVIRTLEKYKRNSGFVYTRNESSSIAESGKNFGKRFQTILKQNNLPHTRFHDLRHFTATMMLKHGVSDKEASSILGHTNINMTRKYQHILKSMEGKAANVLNSIVNQNELGNQNGNQTAK